MKCELVFYGIEPSLSIFAAQCIESVAYAIVWCLSITFVYCVETAKDVAIVATEYEL